MKSLFEYINEAKNYDDILDKIEIAIHKNTKLPKWQDMIGYLQTLNGIEVEIYEGNKGYDTKNPSQKIVTSRHDTKGAYVKVTDTMNKMVIFNQHSSEKTFTWNLANSILKLMEG
jgi:hypothetical protein